MLDFIELTQQMIIRHESMALTVYKCPADKLTIGVGRNLEDKGISREEALVLLENDIFESIDYLKTIFNWDYLSDGRKMVLIDMYHNLGPKGFRSFKKMILAIQSENWLLAVKEMENSRWYKQVGKRALRLCKMMKGEPYDAD